MAECAAHLVRARLAVETVAFTASVAVDLLTIHCVHRIATAAVIGLAIGIGEGRAPVHDAGIREALRRGRAIRTLGVRKLAVHLLAIHAVHGIAAAAVVRSAIGIRISVAVIDLARISEAVHNVDARRTAIGIHRTINNSTRLVSEYRIATATIIGGAGGAIGMGGTLGNLTRISEAIHSGDTRRTALHWDSSVAICDALSVRNAIKGSDGRVNELTAAIGSSRAHSLIEAFVFAGWLIHEVRRRLHTHNLHEARSAPVGNGGAAGIASHALALDWKDIDIAIHGYTAIGPDGIATTAIVSGARGIGIASAGARARIGEALDRGLVGRAASINATGLAESANLSRGASYGRRSRARHLASDSSGSANTSLGQGVSIGLVSSHAHSVISARSAAVGARGELQRGAIFVSRAAFVSLGDSISRDLDEGPGEGKSKHN